MYSETIQPSITQVLSSLRTVEIKEQAKPKQNTSSYLGLQAHCLFLSEPCL